MSINAKEFKKGNSLIVGKKIKDKENEYEIDGVLVYDAYCLSSSNPFLLQCSNLNLAVNEPVYICGHGDGKKQEISGYSMREIAVMLKYNTNISQIKEIVIISCHGQQKNHLGTDMANLLQKELLGLGINVKVESVAEHTTIVVDYFGRALVADKKYLKFLFSTYQTNLQNRFGCLKLIVNNNSVTINQELADYLSQYGKDIAVHNYALISKGKDNKMDDKIIKVNACVLLFLLLSALSIAVGFSFKLGDTWMLVSIIFLIVSIIALCISSGVAEWCIDSLKDLKKK